MATRKMNQYAKFEAFDPDEDNWSEYAERLDMAYVVNVVDDADADKKRAILLTVCGKKTFALLKGLSAPNKPSEVSFADLCKSLSEHCQPKPSVIMERFKFHTRTRRHDESVTEYIAALRKVASQFEFGGELETNIRDRLVCGIGNADMQRKMLLDDGLTLGKAVKIARSEERTAENVAEIQSCNASAAKAEMHVDSDRINYTGGQPSRQTDRREKSGDTREAAWKVCYRCGALSHLANTCSYRTIVCRICQKKGHIARVCRSRPLPPASLSRTVNTVEEYASDPPGEYLGALNYLSGREPHYLNSCQFQASRSNGDGRLKRGSPPITLNVEIDGRSTLMEVDTGASVSVMALGTLEKKLPALKSRLTECSTSLFSYSGKAIPVIGEVEVEVKVAESTEPQKMHKLPLVVVDGEGHTLLGRSWLREIRLDWHNLFVVNGVQSPCGSTVKRLEDILEEHKAVFEEGLGTYSGPHVSIRVKPDAVPKFCKVRPVPYAQREAVEEELARLERQGIIEPVQHSEWASPVVTVLKADRSIRLCGDYKRTLNPYCVVDQ